MSETILLHINAHAATITLNRPDRLNSFNAEMHQALSDALAVVENPKQGVRALMITGAGRGFCAGQDLSDRNVAADAAAPDLGASLENWYNPLVRRLQALPMPVVCAVNGVAAGAGANIALACDLVLAARSASFVQAFCKLGLISDSGGTWTLQRAVGKPRAMGLSLLGDKLSAEKAEQWGMIWQVVDDEKLADEARSLLAHLATQPTAGLALMKQAIHAATDNTLDEQLNLERDLQRQAGQADDYKEGVSAFMAKRPPVFKGR